MKKGVPPKLREKAKSKWIVSVFALLLLLFSCAHARAADTFDFSYDIRYMMQMNPDFSTYSGTGGREPDGVIWLKRVDCGIAPDGGVERQTMWILLGRRGLPSRWLSWNIPVPKGGQAEFLEASIYSTREGTKIGTALPVSPAGDRPDAIRSVTFSGLPEEFILVVHYREVFPDKLSIDDLVWISESLPVWETVIRVTVPAGHPFYHASSPNSIPQVENMVYEWNVLNTAAEVRPSIRVADRGYVVFGSRVDKGLAARLIRAVEGAWLPSPPQVVRDMFGKRQEAQVVENVLNWLYEQPGIVLTSESREIPAEAPWTTREKILLGCHWLKEAGVNARLFWRLPYGPREGKPFCEASIVGPVLEVTMSDSKRGVLYCDMERPPSVRRNEALWEGTVYGLQRANDNLEEHRLRPQKAAENRLKANFNLNLSENGILTGTIDITARNAWRHFLFPEKPTSSDLDEWMKNMFAQVPRYSDLTFKESGTESVVTITLSGTQVIKGTEGTHIMLSLPPLIPEWFKNLNSGPLPYNLSFPFIMDVKVVLALPVSTTNVLLPSQISQSAGKIRYSESYKLDKKKRFLAETHMAVDTTLISDNEAAGLGAAIQNWRSFMTAYLPVQLRAR